MILNHNLREIGLELGVEIHRSVSSLKDRLCQPLNELVAAIIYVAGEKDLSELMFIKDLLWEVPLIIIVDAQDWQTVVRAHSLRPRFLTGLENDFDEVVAVLKRIFDKKTCWSHARPRKTNSPSRNGGKHQS
jgi:hypothetical protein